MSVITRKSYVSNVNDETYSTLSNIYIYIWQQHKKESKSVKPDQNNCWKEYAGEKKSLPADLKR